MDRHVSRRDAEPAPPLDGAAVKRRLAAILVGLLLTITVSIAYMQALFDARFDPLIFVIWSYVLGIACGFVGRFLLSARFAFPLFLIVAAVVLIDMAFQGDSRILFWFVLVPCAGAIAVTVPLGRRPYWQDV
jgi:hypothetical protein